MTKLLSYFSPPFFRNFFVTIFMIFAATASSFFFFHSVDSIQNISILYILSTVLTARFTVGYLPGIIVSLAGVISVNYLFTYPYNQINFTLNGYPVTFFGMLLISLITSASTSHMKKQGELLSKQEKILMEVEKEKVRANLLRAVSHDLRTPLTSMLGASSTYLENEPFLSDSEKRMFVLQIHEDCNWLLNMVENLLTITRISGETAKVTKSLELVEEVISEAFFRLKKRFPDENISVKVPEEPILVPMDALLIEQVILNLMENALSHSHSSKAIECVVRKDTSFMYCDIIDYGSGIPEDQLDTIFDGCSHGKNESSDAKKGFGIGLSICKTIIAAHQGSITARNHNEGAIFTFQLPMEDIEDEL